MKTLQTKLLLLFLVMTLLPLIGMGIYAYRISVNAAQENAGQALQGALKQMGNNLDFQLKVYKKYMDFVVTSAEIKSIFFQSSFDPSKVETLAVNKKLDSMMNGLFYQDESIGPVGLYKGNHLMYMFKGINSSDLQELGYSDIYRSDMRNEGNIKLHTMKVTNIDSDYQSDYYVLGRRLYDSDFHGDESSNAGVYLFVDEKNVSDIIRKGLVNGEGTVMIADGSGNILSHSDKQRMGGRLSDEGITNISDRRVTDRTGSYTSSINGQKVIIGFYKLPQWDLQVIQVVPQQVFTNNIRLISQSTVLVSAMMLVVLQLVAWFLARRLSKPVRTMVRAMKEMQTGNFDVRIEKKFGYEFDILSNAFNFMVIRLKELINQSVEEEKRRGEIEFHMLQYQINPHFVNNTIGSVRLYALAEGAVKVAEVLNVLARLFQRTLGNSSRLIIVRTEIANLKDFIQIQQMQYMTEMSVNYRINDSEMDYLIPNLLLQPLVENAIFHGFSEEIDHPSLTISARMEGEDLVFSLRDNGIGMTEEKINEFMDGDGDMSWRLNKIGVKNVDKRLKIYYGEQYGVTLYSKLGEGTEAVIRMPAIKEKEEDSE